MISNRRAHKRYKKPIFFRITTPKPEELESVDISLGGVLFESRKFYSVNQVLPIEVIIPNKKPVSCEARIAWVYPGIKNEPLYKTGLQFLNLSASDREKLKNFIY